jgi:hypothetical protein
MHGERSNSFERAIVLDVIAAMHVLVAILLEAAIVCLYWLGAVEATSLSSCARTDRPVADLRGGRWAPTVMSLFPLSGSREWDRALSRYRMDRSYSSAACLARISLDALALAQANAPMT